MIHTLNPIIALIGVILIMTIIFMVDHSNAGNYRKSVIELNRELITERTLNAKLQDQVNRYKKCIDK